MYIEHQCDELESYNNEYHWNKISISKADDEGWQAFIPTYEDIGIIKFTFCPWCGKKL